MASKRTRWKSSTFVVNPSYNDSTFIHKFRKELTDKDPFPHWQLRDFLHVNPSVLERIEDELINYPLWNRKENDLYSLHQTADLRTINKVKYPAIAEFRRFLYGQMRDWLENISGVELLSQVDATGSCYATTDCLLPHSDQVDGRRFAFVYYFTDEPWEESFGGYTNIYNSNDDCVPTTIFASLRPYRNSLLLFEVSERSWHSVTEVLGKDNNPRLSINGWFHSNRPVGNRVRVLSTLPRFPILNEGNISYIFDHKVVGDEAKIAMRHIFDSEKELLVKNAFQEEFKNKILEELSSAIWAERGPVNKRRMAEYLFEENSNDGVVARFVQDFRSQKMMHFLNDVIGIHYKDAFTTVQILRLTPGCYTILGDEDVEQFEKDGDSYDFWFYFGKSQWSENAGGQVIYIKKNVVEPVLRCPPTVDAVAIVYREKCMVPFIKYVNHLANSDPFYVIVFSIYGKM
ncbi:hypothetical protein DICVIV_00161 [Dictyocaulus viviparus]|uniref:Prolyl 4-hydroxylase alpha subunit domain-containing protein n=1 Tax=Dictyocaulus viviparus TaxID=29172 RepID=A0A0D8YC17_DICVI|nr:hypothetical protein DICVIV_00161 [Dictyocaulus viviparus]